jgi:hypothetical protein
MKRFFTLLLTFSAYLASAQSTTVVISQVYGGGGATTGTPTYKVDYVELHNKSTSTVDISGFVLAYGSATGQFGSSAGNYYTFPSSTTIAAGKFLLVKVGPDPGMTTLGADLPITADLSTTNLTVSGTSGKVALATAAFVPNSCGATATPCTLPSTTFVDVVAFGTANNGEGGTTASVGVAINSGQGVVRKVWGCQDTDNNANDFFVQSNPVPRNSATTATDCVLLPLSLVSFNGSLIGATVNLTWNTVNEVNVDNYQIEVSKDGRTYTSIGNVAAKNNTSNQYEFIDLKPVAGISYYRIKASDKDGSFKYTNVVTIKNRATSKLEVFPNPTNGALSISHSKASNGSAIRIFTMEGKLVKSITAQRDAVQTAISISELVSGNYQVVFENNGERSVTKIVKQ